jgi:hypothetical protein
MIIHDDGISSRFDILLKDPQDGVVFEKMSQRFGIGNIVDGYELQARIMRRGSQKVSADPAEAVDSDFNCHFKPPSI